MIYAKMSADRSIYPKALQRALNFLAENDVTEMAPGKYPIDGDRIFAVVVDVDLADTDAIRPEAHRTYIDVQYWPSCVTRFGAFPLSDASAVTEAKPESDVWYYQPEADEAFITGRPGSFAVFFPTDVHRPDLRVGEAEKIRKCVVKVDVALLSE